MKNILSFFVFAFLMVNLGAQDFGFEEIDPSGPVSDENSLGISGPKIDFSGRLEFASRVLSDPATVQSAQELGNTSVSSSGTTVSRIRISTQTADLVLGLRLSPEILATTPGRIMDEASLTAFLGDYLELQAGLVKVTWGKGDALHVLDVVNPLDYSDFINPDLEDRKIPQALAKLNLRTGDSGKLEGVLVPFFEGDTLPLTGTWAPRQFTDLRAQVYQGFYYGSNPGANGGLGDGVYAAAYSVTLGGLVQSAITQVYAANGGNLTAAHTTVYGTLLPGLQIQAAQIASAQAKTQVNSLVENLLVTPDTKSLKWAQGGLRYTDSLGGIDLGIQYYTGFLRTPVFNPDPSQIPLNDNHLLVDYNRYHQVGLDTAFVLLDFNIRAEGAFNLTEDWEGTNPLVQNPFFAYTLGLDRTVFGVYTNLQVLGAYRLKADQTSSPLDVESSKDWMSLNAGGQMSYKLLNDRLEVKLTGSYNPRDKDFLINPQVVYSPADDLVLSLSGKYFGGDLKTQLGQYRSNSFLEAKVSFSF